MADDPQLQLAKERTDLAEDRTVLANERTFAGWMRTSLAAVGIGVAFNALFSKMQPEWAPKAIATAFLLSAIYIIVIAERRAASVLSRLDEHKVAELGPMNLRILMIVAVGATAALIAAIWLLDVQQGGR
jgi:putative membrane protein